MTDRKLIAYRLLMALTPKRLSFMLPRIEGMEIFDIPPIYDTLSIDAAASPLNLGFADSAGPLISSRSTGPVSRWFTALDDTYWEAYPDYGIWNETLQRWDHEYDYLYLFTIGTWASGYRPTKVRVAHMGLLHSSFGVKDVDGNVLCVDPTYISGDELDLTFLGPAPGYDIFELILSGDAPNITNIEFLSPVGPCD